MVYSKNISRKKDFKMIRAILDFNEYYEREITVEYDKNFFFYRVNIKMKDEVKNPRDLTGVNGSQLKKLFDAGFILQEYHQNVLDTSGIVTGFSISDSVKYKHLVFRSSLLLVRESEIRKYFMRGSFFE